jgi:DNA-binding MurR/RpiR family transcriptional regulator
MLPPDVFSSTDESGDMDLNGFQEGLIRGLQYYIDQIFLIEKVSVAETAEKLGVSQPTLYRLRNCSTIDYKQLPQLIELATILGVKGTINFKLMK